MRRIKQLVVTFDDDTTATYSGHGVLRAERTDRHPAPKQQHGYLAVTMVTEGGELPVVDPVVKPVKAASAATNDTTSAGRGWDAES